MKVFAGGRGSGKTYSLVHEAMEDDFGVFVVREYHLIRHTELEYPELRGRVKHRDRVEGLPRQSVLYIDEVRNGEDLSWASQWEVGGIAVAIVPSDFENPELPNSYREAIKDLYFNS